LIKTSKEVEKWHILSTKHQRPEETKEEPITRQPFLHWAFALTVVQQSACIPYAVNVATTEENWLLKKRSQHNVPVRMTFDLPLIFLGANLFIGLF